MKQLILFISLTIAAALVTSQTLACSQHAQAGGSHHSENTEGTEHGSSHERADTGGENTFHNTTDQQGSKGELKNTAVSDEDTDDFFDFDDQASDRHQGNHEDHLHAPIGQ